MNKHELSPPILSRLRAVIKGLYGVWWKALKCGEMNKTADYGSEGREFESSAARHIKKGLSTF